MIDYPNDHCPFCYKELDEIRIGTYSCMQCTNNYSVSKYTNNKFSVVFYIDNYKFRITDSDTNIVDLSPGEIGKIICQINKSFMINEDNYLQQIERIKNLQLLK